MGAHESEGSRLPEGTDEFPSTIWKRIEEAKETGREQSREALAEICRAYWRPVYAFIRRKGNDPDRAADLTQDFFTLLLEPGALHGVTPSKGRFRSYLIAACTHFLSNRRAYERALKRGGGRAPVSIERLAAEEGFSAEPFHEMAPERIFLREWAQTLVDRALAGLESEARRKGASRLFGQIKGTLLGAQESTPYAQVAACLGMNEAAVKVAVHRYRVRFRQYVKSEIERTVTDPAEIEEEITTLIQALKD
jgi:RNA polymerase sigma-70 factor (ECF subfamily)